MKALILGSIFYLSIASAFGAGYYEQNVAPCDAESMRRAMDAATLRTGAGITVVRCDAAAATRDVVVSAPVVVEPVPVYVDYYDYGYDCGCASAHYAAPVAGCCF